MRGAACLAVVEGSRGWWVQGLVGWHAADWATQMMPVARSPLRRFSGVQDLMYSAHSAATSQHSPCEIGAYGA